MSQTQLKTVSAPDCEEANDITTKTTAAGMALIRVPYQSKRPITPEWQKTGFTTNSAEVASWSAYGPTNYGVATGSPSGNICVMDFDGPEGLLSLRDLEDRGVIPADGPRSRTGSGGIHIPIRFPEGVTVPNKVGLLDGFDVRGEGGQAIVPPSVHPNGQAYKWEVAVWDAPIPDAPIALQELVLGARRPTPMINRPGGSAVVAEGNRNDTLFRIASRLRGQGLGEAAILAQLRDENSSRCRPPLPDEEVAKIATSVAIRYEPNGGREWNDSGNAAAFADQHAERLRYIADQGSWHVWDGAKWAKDESGEVIRMAQSTVAAMAMDAAMIVDSTLRKKAAAYACRSGDNARLNAMIKIAASDPRIAANSSDFDDLPCLLPVKNGVVDLACGELLSHDPARLTTRAVPVDYDPDAEGSTFQAFLDQILPKDRQEFLQRYLGHGLIGQRRERKFAVMQGRGANGKSVLGDVIAKVLGPFAFSTPANTFLSRDRNEDGPRSDLAGLQGARIVFGMEVPDRRKFDGALVKRLSGDSTFTVRSLYQVERTIKITFCCLLQSNPLPRADEADDALWDRLVMIPFDTVIKPEDQIPDLADRIIAEESPAVLRWLVEGARDYLRHGLVVPSCCQKATEEWRRRISTVPRFLAEKCHRDPAASVGLTNLQRSYRYTVQQDNGNPLGIESFRLRLEALGIEVKEVKGIETVMGLRSS